MPAWRTPWLRAKAIQERLHERVAILDQLHRVRQHHPHGHAVARFDAEVDREQMHDAADEQRAADEEDQDPSNTLNEAAAARRRIAGPGRAAFRPQGTDGLSMTNSQ